ncbi:MAG: hypothetical protein AAGF73_01765 [Actinomycetota bacterium]
MRILDGVAGEFDRAGVERVVQRAAQLDGTITRDGAEPFDDDRLDADTLVAAAAEVGIAPALTRQSIAIERLGPPPTGRVTDRVAGPRAVSGERTVAADGDATIELLDDWLSAGHHLRREWRGRSPGVVEVRWVRRRDLATSVWRRVRGLRGEARLGGRRSVTVQAATAGDDATLVRMTVDRADERATYLGGGAAMVGVGAAGMGLAAAGAVVAAPMALVAAPVALGGIVVVRRGRVSAKRLGDEVQRVLDAVAQQERPAGVHARQRRLRRAVTRNG